MYLTRDAILAASDITTEEVAVPEWGGTVLVRGMTGHERNAYEDAITKETPVGNRAQKRAGQTTREVLRDQIRASLVQWCVVDEQGAHVFTVADIPALNAKSAAALERVVDVATRLSGMNDDDVEKMAEDMQERPFDETS